MEPIEVGQDITLPETNSAPHILIDKTSPFIEANTKSIQIPHLQHDCIIPVFSRDNERTISHQEFIEVTQDSALEVFSNHQMEEPEIRASHQVKGRIPSAIHKSAKELLEHEKTIYYERMAFIIRIPSIMEEINGNALSLVIGGVRAYNHQNLYGRKATEKFKDFIGFQNLVCCNLCISTDGFQSEIRAKNIVELREGITNLLASYRANGHLQKLQALTHSYLSERQFAQLIGRARLYNYLPKEMKSELPELLLNDNHFNTISKDYFVDKSFCKSGDGTINLWNVYNLLTGANKSSYIDTFLDRSANAFSFTEGISMAINGDSNYRWFLS